MPTSIEHLKQAKDNEDLAERLLRLGDEASDTWAATLMFYSALHYGRSFLVRRGSTRISTHGGFESSFRRLWAGPPELFRHYRLLRTSSENARYDCITYNSSQAQRLRDQHLHPFRDAILAALATAP
ncbi:MAG TPA: hypothetical protein VMT64_16765 [Candidatus Binataceae bacterium]|nr:hypothetical protein [Candidatus Binataceae bacterium]